ncbi:caspase family protein [Micromonospora sp. NPDC005189]|uniref:caspase, EACC1-associated type n=1 Tax=unclassified Micromonospora TaxID=2617518 RepID=UPI0033AC104A
MRLPVPEKSQLVLIGTSQFEGEFADHPLSAVRNNVHDLASVLTDADYGGFLPSRCTKIFGEEATGPEDILTQLHAAAQDATDVLLVYLSSHAVRGDAVGNELFIALPKTDRNHPAWRYWSLAFDDIRRIVRQSPAPLRIVVIDTCYAGLAAPEAMGAEHLQISGTATLAAVGPNHRAVAPKGDRHTAFTGALIRLLNCGVDGTGPLLSISDIFPHLDSELASSAMPRPSLHRSENIDGLALVSNRAHESHRIPPALTTLAEHGDTPTRLTALKDLATSYAAANPAVQGLIREAVAALRHDDSKMIAARAEALLADIKVGEVSANYPRRLLAQLTYAWWIAAGVVAAAGCVLVLWRLGWYLPYAAVAAVPVAVIGYLGAVASSALFPAAVSKTDLEGRP